VPKPGFEFPWGHVLFKRKGKRIIRATDGPLNTIEVQVPKPGCERSALRVFPWGHVLFKRKGKRIILATDGPLNTIEVQVPKPGFERSTLRVFPWGHVYH
jgi:hypothetical protein